MENAFVFHIELLLDGRQLFIKNSPLVRCMLLPSLPLRFSCCPNLVPGEATRHYDYAQFAPPAETLLLLSPSLSLHVLLQHSFHEDGEQNAGFSGGDNMTLRHHFYEWVPR